MAANPATRDATEPPEAGPGDSLIRSVRVVQPDEMAGAAGPPWPDVPLPGNVQWDRFMRFLAPLEAHIIAGRLNVEGVPTMVLASPAMDLSHNAEIYVPRALLHRARWVLAWPPASEEELAFLATGEFSDRG